MVFVADTFSLHLPCLSYFVTFCDFLTLNLPFSSYSNILFREFALGSMWRVPAMPIGAHTLLSFLAEPLKQLSESSDTVEDYNVSQNLKEFHDWVSFIFLPLFLFPVNCANLLVI